MVLGTLPEIRADDVGTAWTHAVKQVLAQPGREAFHLTVRIGTGSDAPLLRAAVDQLLRQQSLQPVETVANTIFPRTLALQDPKPSDLSERYLQLYPRLRKYRRNMYGTYFGRLVAYPGDKRNANQLVHVIEKARWELEHKRRTSRYECAIYHPPTDARRMSGFPCLSSCAFHTDAKSGRIHLVAVYRNQHLIARGYGNYLGLARLRDYVADAVGLEPGELMVIAGHARVDGRVPPVRALLGAVPDYQGGMSEAV